MAVDRKRNAKTPIETKPVTSPPKKANVKESRVPKPRPEKKEIPRAPKTKDSNQTFTPKPEKPEVKPKSKRVSAAKENKEPAVKSPKSKGASKMVQDPKPKKPEASPSQASQSQAGTSRGVKRSRISKDDINAAKKAKLDEIRLSLRKPHLDAIYKEGGLVLTVGTGDTGQLGLGPDVMESKMPKVVQNLAKSNVVSISAGGMHTLCVTRDGKVYSFGCNDEGALGRVTEEEDDTFNSGEVKIPGKVIMVSSGDSHSAALTEDGKVYYWGTFRDNSGSFGLTSDGAIHPTPIPLAHHLNVKKVVSGENHIVLLTDNGQLYTLGCGEQGRLGRIGELFVGRGGRRGLPLLLTPDVVHAKNRRVVFADVWAGSMSTVALTTDNEVLVCGLNNYSQLGIDNKMELYIMMPSPLFTEIARDHGLAQVSFGQHHVMLLDAKGKVYSVGRQDYGVLGLGDGLTSEVKVPMLVKGQVADRNCVEIGCGSFVSFAVTGDGSAFGWGMGTNMQLAQSDDDDLVVPTQLQGQQLVGKRVVGVSGGGQHTVLLAQTVA